MQLPSGESPAARRCYPNTEAANGSDGGTADAESDDEEMDYERLRVVELKEQLRARGLPVSGLKEALILRLRAADTRGDSHANEAFDDEEGVDSSDDGLADENVESDADESEDSCEL